MKQLELGGRLGHSKQNNVVSRARNPLNFRGVRPGTFTASTRASAGPGVLRDVPRGRAIRK